MRWHWTRHRIRRAPCGRWGVPTGLATMLLLDDLLVPAAGWGPWPKAEVPGNAYGLASHLVFGITLEGARRAGEALPA